MIPFKVLRNIYRVSWTKDNRDAIQLLNKMFYLMIALKRSHRIQEYLCVHRAFFLMIDSFILYRRGEAKELVDQLLEIPWIYERKADLYRSIIAYNRLIAIIKKKETSQSLRQLQQEFQIQTSNFVSAFKQFTNFNEKDEARIKELLENPEIVDGALKEIYWLSK